MHPISTKVSRRRFLGASALTAASLLTECVEPTAALGDEPVADGARSPTSRLPRVAAINSIYRLRSHAYHIAGRFIHGYTRDDFHHQPPFQLARMYNDQYPQDDMGRDVCARHGIELSKTVAEALGMGAGAGGAGMLDVDAVLLIIEHGEYPLNEFRQIQYPRYELFAQILDVLKKAGRSVPVFVDKHLSYDHQLAAKMVAASRELKFGLMAGSSLPVTWCRPEIEPPLETPFREGLVCFGFERGTPEIYLFHALETLQCMLERRSHGETGVKSVTTLQGDAVWKAADEGHWSWKLLEAALSRCPSNNTGPIRENVREPLAVLVEYRDGTRGAVLNLVEQVSDFGFAGSVTGRAEPFSTCFYLPSPPGARFFDTLTYNIEKLFATGKSPYPVERTLLTSTVLDLAMHSMHEQGRTMTGSALEIEYQPPRDSGFFRGAYVDAG